MIFVDTILDTVNGAIRLTVLFVLHVVDAVGDVDDDTPDDDLAGVVFGTIIGLISMLLPVVIIFGLVVARFGDDNVLFLIGTIVISPVSIFRRNSLPSALGTRIDLSVSLKCVLLF